MGALYCPTPSTAPPPAAATNEPGRRRQSIGTRACHHSCAPIARALSPAWGGPSAVTSPANRHDLSRAPSRWLPGVPRVRARTLTQQPNNVCLYHTRRFLCANMRPADQTRLQCVRALHRATFDTNFYAFCIRFARRNQSLAG